MLRSFLTPDLGNTNEPTTDHTPITTELKTYEVVGDGHVLEQKVSDVSTNLQPLGRLSMLRSLQTRNRISAGDVRTM